MSVLDFWIQVGFISSECVLFVKSVFYSWSEYVLLVKSVCFSLVEENDFGLTCDCNSVEQTRVVLNAVRDITLRAMLEKNFQI